MRASKAHVLLAFSAMLISDASAGEKKVSGLSFHLSPPPKASCHLQPFHIWHEPDRFFENLKQVEANRTLHYRRGDDIVANYPESTTVKVEVWQGLPEFSSCNGLPPYDPAKVKFRLQWQNDSQIVPAKGTSVLSEESSPQTWCEDKCAAHWTYELKIDSQNVPLQDTLVIRIETQDGTRLAEYVGKLTTESRQQQQLFNVPTSP